LIFDLFAKICYLFGCPDENYYKTSSNTIKCKDGSATFTKAQLNDDFCDCPDATDEPGLSLRLLLIDFLHFSLFSIYISRLVISFYVSLFAYVCYSLPFWGQQQKKYISLLVLTVYFVGGWMDCRHIGMPWWEILL
jgi:hypothetical protein